MGWNWQHPDWPRFRFDASRLEGPEDAFLKNGGMLIGAFKHLQPVDETELIVEAATSEALTTSAIEGEILDRESVRSSILRHLGALTLGRSRPREDGVASMLVDLLRSGLGELSHPSLWRWHEMLMQGNKDYESLGGYRIHEDPMQIVSGALGQEKVHFQAPPSSQIPEEMNRYIDWFNGSQHALRPLARAGIAHLYFESIHPFADGNGRIGRAISEKALAQGLGQASLTMLSTEIEARQQDYYSELEFGSRTLEIGRWTEWFAEVVLAAQRRSLELIEFLIAKTKLFDRLKGKLNPRQEKALLRLFREGPGGFTGGLSSGNYQTITGAAPATAGRDLSDLVALGALVRTGEGKGTRYWLPPANWKWRPG